MMQRIRRFFRHVATALRLLVPTRAQGRYARAIARNGLFDRAFYFACNPYLPLLCRLFPERHYVLRGEPMGLCPSPDFSPRAYLALNPDVAASGLAPLAHYMAFGRAQNRLARDLPLGQMPRGLGLAGGGPLVFPDVSQALAGPHGDVAVVVHLYYPELWPELAARLAVQDFAFDLLVTLTGDTRSTADLAARIRAEFPQARVWAMPNHGRDLYPFLYLIQAGVLAPYRAICKLHGKKSLHREDGDDWRRGLVAGVLGEAAPTAARLARFLADDSVGIWVADGHLCVGAKWWGANSARTQALLARHGISAPQDQLRFAAGSIYWIKQALLQRLADLQLGPEDFEPEMGQVDGTTAHALERALGVLSQQAGLEIRESRSL
jgi:hypothetical protein